MTAKLPDLAPRQRVLVLGGTGSIGGPVAQELLNRGHQVTCLARSQESEDHLRNANFSILRGDIRNPDLWIEKAAHFDAVIQAANTWSDDMEQVDNTLISALLNVLSTEDSTKTLIYTGGCWAYGDTGDTIATEQTPYSPIPAFSLSLVTGQQVLTHPGVRGIAIHPAMVYERDGGVLDHMIEDAQSLGEIRVIGTKNISWTMVHRLDLADLYCLALEKGKRGENYNGSSIQGIQVALIAKTLAKRFELSTEPVFVSVDVAVSEIGSWAIGYGLDQKMSSEKAFTELGWSPKYTDILSDIG